MTEETQTHHYVVSGRVQGVGFRWFTRQIAEGYGITGTVENSDNGDVEVFATGTEDMLRLFEEKLHEGPSFGLVNKVLSNKIKTHNYPTFTIILHGRRY